MEMEILVDYSIGAGGSVIVFYQGQNFSIDISEEDDNDYADINLFLLGDSMDETLINVYNRNSLPDYDNDNYEELMESEKESIISEIKESVHNHFSSLFEDELDDLD